MGDVETADEVWVFGYGECKLMNPGVGIANIGEGQGDYGREGTDEEKPGKVDERRCKLADEAEERDTMVHALREEPGSYTTTLEDGTEVTYAIRPTDEGFVAGWNATGLGATGKGHEERFASYADALRYLEENFDAPLSP